MGSCPRCGAPAHADARFCTECGGYLTTTPSFDDLEPPDPSRTFDDPPTRDLGDPVQFSGPPVPALGDADPPPSPVPFQQPPTGEWPESPPRPPGVAPPWAREAGRGQQPPGYGSPGPEPSGHAPFDAVHYGAPPDRSKRRRRGVLYGGVALLAVLVLATVAVLALDLGGGEDSTAEPKDSNSSATTSRESGSPPASTPRGQAKAVDALLSRAAGGKSMLTTAYQQATDCEISPAVAERKFQRAAENRRDIVRSARNLDTSRLAGGPRVKSLLISMYSTSAKADDAFAAWARDGADKGHSCLKENAKRIKGNELSVRASAQKQRFVRVWNPVAADYGHGKRTRTSL